MKRPASVESDQPARPRPAAPSLAWLAALGLSALSSPVIAQSLAITTSLSLTETLTDNRSPGSSGPKQSESITTFSPSVNISSRKGAVQGSLSYALTGVVYASETSRNNAYHTASGSAHWASPDGRAGVDASVSAGRQVLSAFGIQVVDSNLDRGNQAQSYSYSLAPYLSGVLLGDVSYRVRLGYSGTHVVGRSGGESTSLATSAGLAGRLGLLGWTLDASRSESDIGSQSGSRNDRVTAGLSYSPDVAWSFSVRAGWETDNLRSSQSQGTTTWGVGVAWSPGPRTSVRLDYDHRFFGQSHSYVFSHRMARTVWTWSDSRSLNSSTTAGRAVVSLYDLYFSQFASIEPDATRRDVLVRNFLAANGLSASSLVVLSGFATGVTTVQRSQAAAVAYQALRTAVTVSATQSRTERIGASGGLGDLADSQAIRQQGLSVTVSHRLTEDSTLIVTGSQQRTPSTAARSGNELRSIVATWSARLGNRTNASLSVRHSRFDSDTNPYTESALVGSLNMQF